MNDRVLPKSNLFDNRNMWFGKKNYFKVYIYTVQSALIANILQQQLILLLLWSYLCIHIGTKLQKALNYFF